VKPKPSGLDVNHATQFDDPTIVAAYGTRPPYPESLVTLLLEVAGKARPRLLDMGCGTGELTRRLSSRVAAITAVDRSARMIAAARLLPGGDATNINWVVGEAEDAPLAGDFDLALAAESFHWFDWPRACKRIKSLVPSSKLFIVETRSEQASPWAAALAPLIERYSTNREYEPYDLIGELVSRGLLSLGGSASLAAEPFRQSVADYITSIHSRNGFSRDRMGHTRAQAFDASVQAVVEPHEQDGMLPLMIAVNVAWGIV
jgi:SAM-dependent methyltransferase